MPEIDRLTFEIEKYADRTDIRDKDKITRLKTLGDVIADVTAKIMLGKVTGVFANCTLDTAPSDPTTKLPDIPGFIFRDESTKRVVGPGEWMPILVKTESNVGLVIPGVGIIAMVEASGLYCFEPDVRGSAATAQKAKDHIEEYLASGDSLHGYRIETTHHITAEVVGDVEYKNYTCFHLQHITGGSDYFSSADWITRTRAEECYESHVAGKIPCSLCGFLPGGVPVLLKSYDPNAEIEK